MAARDTTGRFVRIATAEAFFQGGAAAVDTGTIMASLVHGLTGSSLAVGATAAVSRYGWLIPQFFVAWMAQARRRRMPFYLIGAFGRIICLLGAVAVVLSSGQYPTAIWIGVFFAIWALYACVGGILAAPHNDIVARSIQKQRPFRFRSIQAGLSIMVPGCDTAHLAN